MNPKSSKAFDLFTQFSADSGFGGSMKLGGRMSWVMDAQGCSAKTNGEG